MNFKKALKLAKEAAKKSNMKYKLGSIIYDKKKFAIGWNRGLGCEVETRNNSFSIHSEEMSILKGIRIGINFEEATLIVVRVSANGDVKCSKPCLNCQKLIEKVGIRQIYYIG